VILEVKGAEKVSWLERVSRNVDGRTEHHWEKRKGKKEVFKYRAPCFQFSVPVLMPGDYTIPFQFMLPASLPSSMNFKDTKCDEKPKAKVKYHIKAILTDQHNKEAMKYKQVLILREQGDTFQVNINQSQENRISTWCCVDQGPSKISVQFEKNVFEPTEVCKAIVNIDNSGCNLAMNGVRLAMEQELTLTSDSAIFGGSHRFHKVYTLANREQAGIAARTNASEPRLLELDLKTIKYNAPATKKKKGVEKPLSVEDRFMMENMQPKCTGKHVKNEYFLTVRCGYEGCTCCASLPVCRVPITIVPIINPQVWGYQQPQDFNPHVYQSF
jgi:hypothetical protein